MAQDVPNALTQSCVTQLIDYFTGHRKHFSLPLAPVGTAYQHKHGPLQQIEFGQTWSRQLVKYIGQPTGSRSVGNKKTQLRSSFLAIVLLVQTEN